MHTKNVDQPLLITRLINAPLDLVWQAHSEAQHLQRWWGPVGKKLIVKQLDFRPGGLFHYGMEATDGSLWWGRFLYLDIQAPHSLVYLSSFADENGEIARAPFSQDFPLCVENTLTLHAEGDKTRLTLQGLPHDANTAERDFFAGMFRSMHGGFNATYAQLDAHLATRHQNTPE